METAGYPIAAITESVLVNGAVLAYTDRGSQGVFWHALPVIDFSILFGFGYTLGFGILELTRPAGTPPAANLFGNYRVRFMIFQPSAAARLKDVDTKDYQAVRRLMEAP